MIRSPWATPWAIGCFSPILAKKRKIGLFAKVLYRDSKVTALYWFPLILLRTGGLQFCLEILHRDLV